jgi:hypothetical protein
MAEELNVAEEESADVERAQFAERQGPLSKSLRQEAPDRGKDVLQRELRESPLLGEVPPKIALDSLDGGIDRRRRGGNLLSLPQQLEHIL